MPAYTLGGKIVLMTAAFKAHAALNFWRGQELRGQAADDDAMGQFGKLRSVGDLPADVELDRLIVDAAKLSTADPAPRKAKASARPRYEMHPEFLAALDEAPAARQAFDAFAPSAQRDYVEWIADAKRDATRAKRIATAVEWLSEGKKRHWQYERR